MRRVLHLMFVFKPIPVSGEILSDETFLLIRHFIRVYDLLGSRGDSEPHLRPQVNSESSSSDNNPPFFFFFFVWNCLQISRNMRPFLKLIFQTLAGARALQFIFCTRVTPSRDFSENMTFKFTSLFSLYANEMCAVCVPMFFSSHLFSICN